MKVDDPRYPEWLAAQRAKAVARENRLAAGFAAAAARDTGPEPAEKPARPTRTRSASSRR